MTEDLHSALTGQKIAYFSMEIGLTNDIPTYSGGLGIIAGDTLKSDADLGLPMIAYYFNGHRMVRRYVTEAYL